jgi:hypothetical protein
MILLAVTNHQYTLKTPIKYSEIITDTAVGLLLLLNLLTYSMMQDIP